MQDRILENATLVLPDRVQHGWLAVVLGGALLGEGGDVDHPGRHRLADVGVVEDAEQGRGLNLPERLWDLPPATFSGGEQQRVNIARGLIAERLLRRRASGRRR
jgi:ABC-type phosphonate transport system ATPase subunit